MSMYFRGKDYDTTDSARRIDERMLRLLWLYARPFKGLFAAALLVMLLGTAADLVRPYLLKIAIDEQVAVKDAAGLMRTAGIYVATIVSGAVLAYGQAYLLQYIGQRIIFDVRQKVFTRLTGQPYREAAEQPVGRMVTRVTNDIEALRDLYTDVLVAFAGDSIILTGIVIAMLVMDWQMALISFAVVPLMVVMAATYQKYARQAYRLVRERTAAINTFIQETLNGILAVKGFARFNRTEQEYAALNRDYLGAGLKEMRTFAIFRPLVEVIYTIAIILVLWSSGWQKAGSIDVGVVIAFLRYVEKFFWPIKDLAEKYNLLQSAIAAAERVYDLLTDAAPAEGQDQYKYTRDLAFTGRIAFENVWFAYQEQEWVLRGLSFEIMPGEFVGIAGLSGSGKTTVLRLLLRFYEPQRGRITIDGIDIKDIHPRLLRKKIGAVFQDVHVFKGTVADNISLYDPAMTTEQIVWAAKMANLDRFVRELPHHYNTEVGYQGALLSAGQRQLLSLARALAVQPDILVLDEATSSVDSQTEAMIQNALEKIGQKRSMLVIAHRLSTIERADKILILHKGRVVEEGTHETLMARRGFYYRLYCSQ
ncbi:ABC transporter ATP-binding protein [Sporolituus thermophilus]|uniref:ATP-binding cassette, subfamily B n=1 Tax=Sporolituus thermophilus DSM 23256 TaxID=1123285 RepID=A0A1G7LE36_9FIRM|nr:ABC transporter ATP-binding protein [Sporolituus thermophilus]SDF47787.1 ATP-binding cassette, subfamily B [Sporolituus thermophilus DSM 23256]